MARSKTRGKSRDDIDPEILALIRGEVKPKHKSKWYANGSSLPWGYAQPVYDPNVAHALAMRRYWKQPTSSRRAPRAFKVENLHLHYDGRWFPH